MNEDIYQAEILDRKREEYLDQIAHKREDSFIVGIVAGMAALAIFASIVITIWTMAHPNKLKVVIARDKHNVEVVK